MFQTVKKDGFRLAAVDASYNRAPDGMDMVALLHYLGNYKHILESEFS